MAVVVWLHRLGPTKLGTVSLKEVGGPKHVGDRYLRADERVEDSKSSVAAGRRRQLRRRWGGGGGNEEGWH